MVTESWTTPGEYTWTVPVDAPSEVPIVLRGGNGGDAENVEGFPPVSDGGEGGVVDGTIPVSPGDTLTIRVGGAGAAPSGGYNGGADSGGSWSQDGDAATSGGGGGASDVRLNGTSLSDRLVVAAGGGGGSSGTGSSGVGGAGGATTGEDGEDTDIEGGDGGTQSSGGSGGYPGGGGSLGVGGPGEGGGRATGGGGGGGYYGGGGGAEGQNDSGFSFGSGGGGGGSNYVGGAATVSTNQRGGSTGDGEVVISYESTLDTPQNLRLTDVAPDSISLAWDGVSGGAEGYRLYASSSPGVTTADTLVAETASTSATDAGLLNGRDRYYRVLAYASGESELSSEVSATTILPAPTGLTVDAVRAAEADVSWTTNASDADAHRVYVKEGDGRTGMSLPGGTNDHIFAENTGSPADTTYFVRFVAESITSSNNPGVLHATVAGGDLSTVKTIGIWIDSDAGYLWGRVVDTDGQTNFTESSGTVIQTGEVQTAAVTVSEGGSATLYANGSPDESVSIGTLTDHDRVQIGIQGNSSESLDGDVYEVIKYDRALSSAEISQLDGGTLVTDGLIGYWPLDVMGRSAPDVFGDTYNGIVDGASLEQPGPNDQPAYLSFDGVDDYVDLGSSDGLGFAAGQSFSVSWWFRSTDGSGGAFVSNSYSDTGIGETRPWYLSRTDGNIEFFLRDSGGTDNQAVGPSYTDGNWHHAVGVYDASQAEVRLYFDDTLVDTVSNVPEDDYGQNGGPLILGEHSDGYSDMDMSDLRLYAGALSSSDVSDLYSGGSASSSIVAHWPLNGSTPDVSGRGNDAAIDGATLAGPEVVDATGSLSGSAESATPSNLLNGQLYEAFVHAETEDATARDQ
jgi:hypothetical protein